MTAVFKREFRNYFSSPLGYVVLTALFAFSGIFFAMIFASGYADISYVISSMFTIVMFAVPILTMRLISEEFKQKTDQALLTAPVSVSGIVLGKFFAALAIFAIGFAPTLVYQIILAANTSLNWLFFFNAILGALLYGAALIAIGLFISSLTESQVVSAVLSVVISILITLLDSFAAMITNTFLSKLVGSLSFLGRFETFATGILDFSNVIFFLSISAVFIFLTVRALEKKRWA